MSYVWTSKTPTVDGYYWYREVRSNGKSTMPCVLYFFVDEDERSLSTVEASEWAGPIPEPQDDPAPTT